MLPLNPTSREQRLIGDDATLGEATIHRKETRESADGEPRYYFYYNFEDVDQSAVRSSVSVGKRLFDAWEIGDQVEVRFLSGDPVLHYLPEFERSDFVLRAVLMGLVVATFFLFLLEAKRRRHRRLVRDGRAVPGVVEKVSSRGAAKHVTVSFATQHTEQKLKATIRSARLAAGDSVTVLYDPSDPREAELYRACLYRAV